ncbi:homeobox-domain-containing protein [Gloeophyllum trabeum ATCC 11539]|uniref:Homeobox-domain-containing protein n=1 Tax=Gloeophyllum trabeum (strain ATCC 11539 / FP-39264 / Madison 617) TaxID=670483 RepID=S7QD60_GLOTA|nr:homeobox-domain-containing protein [Gloeophyllum trabeum ATCC 11539]EPQ57328.1 homeobox-domain-containing protein [Gloeophyllum trabeum ATCC 11539]
MDNHFPSDDHFHPHLPNHGIPSDQHALYRIPSSQSMGPAASPGQATSLYPAPVMQQRRPSMEQDMYASSCIPPSCLPPGTDPTSVDFRTFYPYVPNEVKHRRRTSRQQLKVLEATFKDQTKPNGVLRKRLAQELHMTPRSVQVWFQNRRAKEKTLANKKSDAKGNKGKPDNSPIPEDMPSPSHSSASDLRTMSERTESPEIVEVKGPVSAPEMSSPEPASESPAARPIAPRLPLQSHSSPAFSTIPENSGSIHCRHPMLSDNELQNFRRGSLPTIVYRNLPGPSDESLAKRRSSVDARAPPISNFPPDYNESTDLKAYSFPSSARKEGDSVDDSSSSYDQSISPRGSISSVADSESSVTSAWYSDVGSVGCGSVEYPHGFHPDSRRESCASGILVAFSGLDVGGSPSAATFSPPDGQAVDASASPHQPDQDSAGSPRMEEPAQSIPISTSSELAHAFAVKQEEFPKTHTSGSDGGFMNSSLGTGMVAEDTKVGPAGGCPSLVGFVF